MRGYFDRIYSQTKVVQILCHRKAAVKRLRTRKIIKTLTENRHINFETKHAHQLIIINRANAKIYKMDKQNNH